MEPAHADQAETATKIKAIWQRIEAVLLRKAPRVAKTLAPPVSLEELEDAESVLGFAIPSQLRTSLLIHNGQVDPSRLLNIAPFGKLLSAKEIADSWEMTALVDNGLRSSEPDWDNPERGDWWNVAWVPFFGMEGDLLCVNLNPRDRFALGSETIVCFIHDSPHESNVASSYDSWLDGVAVQLESDRTSVDADGYLDFADYPSFPVGEMN